MSEVLTETKITIKDELYEQFGWFNRTFSPLIQAACDEFLSDVFSLKLIALSKNMNVLSFGDDFFVTKIRVNRGQEAFFRCSASAVKTVFDRILGEKKQFELDKITELEAKILSSFCDYMYGHVSKAFAGDFHSSAKKAKNQVHLTFFIKDKESSAGGKIIISIPSDLVSPTVDFEYKDKFDISDFKSSKVDVNIKVGTTKFALRELKNLEKEDIVVFENSDINQMELLFGKYKKVFRLSPNPGLIIPISDDGGHKMSENSLSHNLWDDIQVEMGAEFEKVKISLGELKNIEQGLVIDISSVYDNKISLSVENKVIAKGELVIVNDRYGVKIDEVFSSEKTEATQMSRSQDEPEVEEPIQTESSEDDEEFDYSDFDIDDEDI